MHERPLVSVIIPTYNRRELVVESVHSVLGQGGEVARHTPRWGSSRELMI